MPLQVDLSLALVSEDDGPEVRHRNRRPGTTEVGHHLCPRLATTVLPLAPIKHGIKHPAITLERDVTFARRVHKYVWVFTILIDQGFAAPDDSFIQRLFSGHIDRE